MKDKDNNISALKQITWYDINKDGHIEGLLENKAAIYVFMKIRSETRYYVGSSIKLNKRLRDHRYSVIYWSSDKKNKSGSPIFYNSVIKYGWKHFQFAVLEYIDLSNVTDIKEKRKNILDKEQFYLDLLKPSLNISKTAGSPLGVKCSENFSINMSKARRGTKYVKTKIRVSIASKAIPSEARLYMSSRSKGISVKIFDQSNNLLFEFPSIAKTAKHFGVVSSTIRTILKTGKYYDNYIYKAEMITAHPVVITNKEDNSVKLYDSMRAAEKYFCTSHRSLSYYINTGKLYKGIYLITRKKDLDE